MLALNLGRERTIIAVLRLPNGRLESRCRQATHPRNHIPHRLHRIRIRLLLQKPCRSWYDTLWRNYRRVKALSTHCGYVELHDMYRVALTRFETGDGLRADLLFTPNAFSSIDSTTEVVAPYLRSIVEKRGAFGVSHTRVPTESRPGHVAIIGLFVISCHAFDIHIGMHRRNV